MDRHTSPSSDNSSDSGGESRAKNHIDNGAHRATNQETQHGACERQKSARRCECDCVSIINHGLVSCAKERI